MTKPTTCREAHIDPKCWNRGRAKDGTVRAYCPVCKKFLGIVPKETP